jgi:hypothetical protein
MDLSTALARLSGTYASLDYEGKQALQEYFAAMSAAVDPPKQPREIQRGGMMPGGR